MYEVELKVRADHAPVRERLDELGAQHLGAVTQVDTYYDAPHRSFAETDEALRIRRESRDDDERTAITYKGPKVDDATKTREEYETGVEDPAAAAGIFEGLGYEAAAEVHKERERYSLEGVLVVLDSVDGLGTFVEVELEASEAGVSEARERATDALRDLGLDPDEGIRVSYLELLAAED